jgi:DNA-binding CsgD family transcriptional regulator
VNTALQVLLDKRDRDRSDMEENIHHNCETLILPVIEQLKDKPETGDRQKLLYVLESALKEVLSPFSKHLTDPLYGLTPRETRIAALIRQGLSSKEIAGLLKISVRTVTGHRDHIRKKLGLRNRKANLQTYVTNLE